MIEDETPAEGVETSGGTEPTPSATSEGEQPVAEGDEGGYSTDPEDESEDVELDADAEAEAEASVEADVNAGGEVEPTPTSESISSGEGGETEVVSGDTEPKVLNSGDELPAHRESVG